ncbi:hypothetical protein GCM10027053_34430 [Intrasporangium mesophilum]
MPSTIRVAHETGVAGVVVAGGAVVVDVCGAVVEGGTVGTVEDVGPPGLVLPGAEELDAPASGGPDEQAVASIVSPTTTTAGQRRLGRRRRGRR